MSEQPQNPEIENQEINSIESDNKIVAQRTVKVRELEAMNINPWGERFDGAEKCAALCASLREICREEEEFRENLPSAAEADRLKLMLDEINAVNPEPGEDETLADKFRMASNAREIIGISEGLVQLLSESENSIADLMGTVYRKLDDLSRLGASCDGLSQECTVIQEGIEQLGRELSDLSSKVDLDPEELASIENRMGDIFTLKRRYGPSLEELFANRDRAAEELARYNAAAATAAAFAARIAHTR